MSTSSSQTGHPNVIEAIRRQIAGDPREKISFHDFMALCLYHEPYGYYTSERRKIGKDGDFYTSSALGGLLAETVVAFILKQSGEWLELSQPLTFVEWGGGTGQFAQQFLDELAQQAPHVFQHLRYQMIEKSEAHRSLQKQALLAYADECVQWLTEEEWFTTAAQQNIIVFSNELIDAFPVHIVERRGDQLRELFVCWEDERFAWSYSPVEADSAIANYITTYYPHLVDGQRVEVNLQALDWLSEVANKLPSKQAMMMTIDYGDRAEELSAAHRMAGTLMCYARHIANDQPLERVAEQDITAHVNFTALLETGEQSGLQTLVYQTQKEFLMTNGLLDKLQSTLHITDPFHPLVKRNRHIRQLLLGEQMSELFKVLIQGKGE
jgi:SAM-dependent MidA family methyltransferase